MKLKNRLISLLLTLAMLAVLIPGLGIEAAAASHAPATLINPAISPVWVKDSMYTGQSENSGIVAVPNYEIKWTDVGQEYFNVAVKVLDGEPDPGSENESGEPPLFGYEQRYRETSVNVDLSTAVGKWVKVFIQAVFSDGHMTGGHYYFKVGRAKFNHSPALDLSTTGHEISKGVYGIYNPGNQIVLNCTVNYSDHIFVQTSSNDLVFTNIDGFTGRSGTFIEATSSSKSTIRSYVNGKPMQIVIDIPEGIEPGDYTISVTATDGVYDPDTFSSISGTAYYNSVTESIMVKIEEIPHHPTTEELSQTRKAIIARAYEWYNTVWEVKKDIIPWNRNTLKVKDSIFVRGIPYSCKNGHVEYAIDASSISSNYFSLSDTNIYENQYGADCVQFVWDCIYAGYNDIGKRNVSISSKCEEINWEDLLPGDILLRKDYINSKGKQLSDHVILIIDVEKNNTQKCDDDIYTIMDCTSDAIGKYYDGIMSLGIRKNTYSYKSAKNGGPCVSYNGDNLGEGYVPCRIIKEDTNSFSTSIPEKHITIYATAGVGGSISNTGKTSVTYNDSITYIITPNDGYEIDSVIVDGSNRGAVSQCTFNHVDKNHTIVVSFHKTSFTDIDKTDTYYDAVKYVSQNNLMVGITNSEFAPHKAVTRAMIMTILGRVDNIVKPESSRIEVIFSGNTDFSDVEPGTWYAPYVEWGRSIGIVKGYDDQKFGPNDELTIEAALVFLYRYAEMCGYSSSQNGASISKYYSDYKSVSGWATDAMQWAINEGLYVPESRYLNPQKPASRALVATMICNFADKLKANN